MCNSTSKQSHQNAYPPLEAILVIISLLGLCVSLFPRTLESIDTVATLDVISTPLFEDAISKYALGCIRLTIALVFTLTTAYRMTKKGHDVVIPYLGHSKLKRLSINLDGVRSQIMFTQWCWNLQTVSFALNGYIALLAAAQAEEDEPTNQSLCTMFTCSPETEQKILRLAILLFEVSAPCSLLVSTVTKYALWPQSLKGKNGSKPLRRPVALLQHNANILSSLFELGVLGRLPVRLIDWPVAPVFGIVYLLFSWSIIHSLHPSGAPQFVYFFFDTTLSKKWTIGVMLVLLSVLLFAYVTFAIIGDVLLFFNGGLVVNCVSMVAFGSLFCRFRD